MQDRQPVPRKWTFEEYVEYEIKMGVRHEFYDGDIFAMVGGTDRHSRVISHVMISLGSQILGQGCNTYNSDMRVQVATSKYIYPDMSIVCGDAQFKDDKRTTLTNPTLVVEVLSPSTADYDRTTKLELYMTLPSLKYCLIIDPNRVAVNLYSRLESSWKFDLYHRLDALIELPDIGCQLLVSDIYRDIDLDDVE